MRIAPLPLVAAGAGLTALGLLVFWPRARARRVALVGDSLAVGLTAPLSQLAASSSVPLHADAHGGTTPLQWSQGAAACAPCGSWLAGFAPSTILVVLGTNDIGYGASPPPAPYQQLAARWGGIGEVVWVEPPMMPSDRLSGVRRVIESLGVATIPAMSGLSFGQDGIHPTDYAPWARFIWERMP